MTKMDKINVDDLKLRDEVSPIRLGRRARLRELQAAGMPKIDRAVEKFDLDDYYKTALNLISSGRAREAFNLRAESDKLRPSRSTS